MRVLSLQKYDRAWKRPLLHSSQGLKRSAHSLHTLTPEQTKVSADFSTTLRKGLPHIDFMQAAVSLD